MISLHYEESLSSWEVAAYARPKLSIRITDGCYRLVTHIPMPVGLALEAREAWHQERREQAFCRFFRSQSVCRGGKDSLTTHYPPRRST